MPGRRAALAVVFTGAAAFSGGVALAAPHGSSHTLQPPRLLPTKPQATNWHVAHHYCHKDASISASL